MLTLHDLTFSIAGQPDNWCLCGATAHSNIGVPAVLNVGVTYRK